ncbi:hypothetical protein, partial [Burkholderia thailandensis]|uniref:hypothetical protein n=1 Tax=Burkholderia thailandensis TaxID=57975 RepID=UPI001E5349D3
GFVAREVAAVLDDLAQLHVHALDSVWSCRPPLERATLLQQARPDHRNQFRSRLKRQERF